MAVGRTAMWHVSVSLLPQERTPHIAGRSLKAALKLHCSWRRELSCNAALKPHCKTAPAATREQRTGPYTNVDARSISRYAN